MRFVVTCPECVGRISDYPDKEGADGLVRRHHMLVGHTANVQRVLDTPLRGAAVSEQSAADVIAEALRIDADDAPDSWARKVWPHRAEVALAALEAAGWAVVAVDDLRQVLRNGVDWTDDHGPTVRLADAVNAAVTHRSAREADK